MKYYSTKTHYVGDKSSLPVCNSFGARWIVKFPHAYIVTCQKCLKFLKKGHPDLSSYELLPEFTRAFKIT